MSVWPHSFFTTLTAQDSTDRTQTKTSKEEQKSRAIDLVNICAIQTQKNLFLKERTIACFTTNMHRPDMHAFKEHHPSLAQVASKSA